MNWIKKQNIKTWLLSFMLICGAVVTVYHDCQQLLMSKPSTGSEFHTYMSYSIGGLQNWTHVNMSAAWRARFTSGMISSLFVGELTPRFTYMDYVRTVGVQSCFWLVVGCMGLLYAGGLRMLLIGLLLVISASTYNASLQASQILLSWDFPLFALSCWVVAGYANKKHYITAIACMLMLLFKESAFVFLPMLYGMSWIPIAFITMLMLVGKYTMNYTVGFSHTLATTNIALNQVDHWWKGLYENFSLRNLSIWPFANCGTLLVVYVTSKLKDWPLLLTMTLSIVGNLICGNGLEIRIFFECIPLATYLLYKYTEQMEK